MQQMVIEGPQLRIQCDPTETVSKGEHKHLCKGCGTCWKHSGTILRECCSSDEFKLAHCCPNCGNEQRLKHRTTKEESEVDKKLCEFFSGPDGFANFLYAILSGKEPECLAEEI